MRCEEIMSKDLVSLPMEASVWDAARKMAEKDIGFIPIIDKDGKAIGTVTDRDIVVQVVAESRPFDTPVREIAAKQLVTVDPQQPVDEAMRLMAEHQLRRLPVCDNDGQLVGIVAQADVARVASPERTGETVEQISR